MNIYCNLPRDERSALNRRVKLGLSSLIIVKTTYAGATGYFFATNYRDGLGLVSKNCAGNRDQARGSVALARYGRKAVEYREKTSRKTAKVVVAEAA